MNVHPKKYSVLFGISVLMIVIGMAVGAHSQGIGSVGGWWMALAGVGAFWLTYVDWERRS